MKKINITFWITTGLIVLFEGVMPALTSQTEMAKEGIRHLGYPIYFGNILTAFKVAGSLGLILPIIKGWKKEWIYAGFAFDFVFAFLSLAVVDGLTPSLLVPIISLFILALSYKTYHIRNNSK